MTVRMFAPGKLLIWWLAVFAWAAPEAGAQTYPTRAIRLIVPYSPGGGVDVMARLLAPKLGERLGQQVVVDNRPGATGNIGAEVVARSAPDGYTVLMVGSSIAANVTLYRKLGYDLLKDFVPVTLVASSPNIVLVHPSLPARSIKELIALARARPGQLNYASGGSGSTLHLTAELFKTMAGVDLVHVPYRGTGPAIVALMSGEAVIAMPPVAGMLPHVESGRLRALAITGKTRLKIVPQLPTVAESGVSGFEAGQWYGVLVPAGTPAAIVTRLQDELARVVRLPDIAEHVTREGTVPVGNASQAFGVYLRQEIEKWAKVVKASGAHVE
ncbi:MAG TPA: tripartite tricarboxylate transporter substrate binding protein [Burkholderiales bacterium]|nr:tripartite tricarboxylate transporter substrate binding protein [Burkholderiales bacterium]